MERRDPLRRRATTQAAAVAATAVVAGALTVGVAVALGLAIAIYAVLATRAAHDRALRHNLMFVHEKLDPAAETSEPTASVAMVGDGSSGASMKIASQARHNNEWLGEAEMPPELRRGLNSGVVPSHVWWGSAMVPLDAAAALRVKDAWESAGRPGRRWWHLQLDNTRGQRTARLELRDSQHMVPARIALPTEVPDRLDPGDRITRRITTFWAQGSPVPVRMANVWDAWRRQHRGYEFRVYDDAAARAMLVHFFDHRVVAAYDALIPASYRSDLFAACALFVYGGFFIDAKIVPRPGFSFEDHVPHDVDMYMTPKLGNAVGVRDGFWKGIMGAKPGNPVLREVIDRICDRVEHNDIGIGPLDTTGDQLYGRAFNSVFGLRRRHFDQGMRRLVDRDGAEHTVLITRSRRFPGPEFVVDASGRRLMDVEYYGYREDQAANSMLPHYSKLWRARRVFRRDAPPLPRRGAAFPLRKFVRAVRRESRAEQRRQRHVNKSMD